MMNDFFTAGPGPYVVCLLQLMGFVLITQWFAKRDGIRLRWLSILGFVLALVSLSLPFTAVVMFDPPADQGLLRGLVLAMVYVPVGGRDDLWVCACLAGQAAEQG
ncbi:MAG: hypothetical protein ACO1TE_19725 [Prosthecobacter sp.]